MTSYRKSMTQALQEVYKVNEQEDHEVSMARGELEAIADKAIKLASMLKDKSDSGNPLEAWVQSKITKAKDYITSVSDYMEYTPEMNEDVGPHDMWDPKTGEKIHVTTYDRHIELQKKGWVDKDPKKNEEVKLDEFTSNMIKALQKSYATMPQKISPEQATALSKHLDRLDLVSLKQLVKANIPFVSTVAKNKVYKKTGKFEEVELEEGLMSNIATLKSEFQRLDTDYKKMKDQYNAVMAGAYKGDESEMEKKMYKSLQSIKDVRQELSNALKTVKEEVIEEGFSANLISKAKEIAKKLAGNMTKAYDEIEKIAKGLSKDNEVQKALRMANEELGRPNPSNPNPKEIEEGIMSDIFNMDKEGATAAEISKKLKLNIDNVKKILGKNESIEEAKDTPAQSDNSDELQKQISVLQGQVNLLKQKLENEKNKTVKAQPNRETGEVPLTVGIAHKLLKDKEEKEKEMKKEAVEKPTGELKDACWKGYTAIGTKMKNGKEVPNCVPEGAKQLVDSLMQKKLKERK